MSVWQSPPRYRIPAVVPTQPRGLPEQRSRWQSQSTHAEYGPSTDYKTCLSPNMEGQSEAQDFHAAKEKMGRRANDARATTSAALRSADGRIDGPVSGLTAGPCGPATTPSHGLAAVGCVVAFSPITVAGAALGFHQLPVSPTSHMGTRSIEPASEGREIRVESNGSQPKRRRPSLPAERVTNEH